MQRRAPVWWKILPWEKAAARLMEILQELESLQKGRSKFGRRAIARLWPFDWSSQ